MEDDFNSTPDAESGPTPDDGAYRAPCLSPPRDLAMLIWSRNGPCYDEFGDLTFGFAEIPTPYGWGADKEPPYPVKKALSDRIDLGMQCPRCWTVVPDRRARGGWCPQCHDTPERIGAIWPPGVTDAARPILEELLARLDSLEYHVRRCVLYDLESAVLGWEGHRLFVAVGNAPPQLDRRCRVCRTDVGLHGFVLQVIDDWRRTHGHIALCAEHARSPFEAMFELHRMQARIVKTADDFGRSRPEYGMRMGYGMKDASELLLEAAKEGNLEAVREILQDRADEWELNAAFARAAAGRMRDAAFVLIKAGARVDFDRGHDYYYRMPRCPLCLQKLRWERGFICRHWIASRLHREDGPPVWHCLPAAAELVRETLAFQGVIQWALQEGARLLLGSPWSVWEAMRAASGGREKLWDAPELKVVVCDLADFGAKGRATDWFHPAGVDFVHRLRASIEETARWIAERLKDAGVTLPVDGGKEPCPTDELGRVELVRGLGDGLRSRELWTEEDEEE